MRFNRSPVTLTFLFLVGLLISRLGPLEAVPKSPSQSGTPIIGDRDKDAAISQDEAESLIQNTNLKERLLEGPLKLRAQFYHPLEKRIRVKLVRLGKAYDTPKSKFAFEQCRKLGITESDAIRIAKIITKVRSAI